MIPSECESSQMNFPSRQNQPISNDEGQSQLEDELNIGEEQLANMMDVVDPADMLDMIPMVRENGFAMLEEEPEYFECMRVMIEGFKYDFDHNDRSVLQFLGNHVTEWVGMVLEKNGFQRVSQQPQKRNVFKKVVFLAFELVYALCNMETKQTGKVVPTEQTKRKKDKRNGEVDLTLDMSDQKIITDELILPLLFSLSQLLACDFQEFCGDNQTELEFLKCYIDMANFLLNEAKTKNTEMKQIVSEFMTGLIVKCPDLIPNMSDTMIESIMAASPVAITCYSDFISVSDVDQIDLLVSALITTFVNLVAARNDMKYEMYLSKGLDEKIRKEYATRKLQKRIKLLVKRQIKRKKAVVNIQKKESRMVEREEDDQQESSQSNRKQSKRSDVRQNRNNRCNWPRVLSRKIDCINKLYLRAQADCNGVYFRDGDKNAKDDKKDKNTHEQITGPTHYPEFLLIKPKNPTVPIINPTRGYFPLQKNPNQIKATAEDENDIEKNKEKARALNKALAMKDNKIKIKKREKATSTESEFLGNLCKFFEEIPLSKFYRVFNEHFMKLVCLNSSTFLPFRRLFIKITSFVYIKLNERPYVVPEDIDKVRTMEKLLLENLDSCYDSLQKLALIEVVDLLSNVNRLQTSFLQRLLEVCLDKLLDEDQVIRLAASTIVRKCFDKLCNTPEFEGYDLTSAEFIRGQRIRLLQAHKATYNELRKIERSKGECSDPTTRTQYDKQIGICQRQIQSICTKLLRLKFMWKVIQQICHLLPAISKMIENQPSKESLTEYICWFEILRKHKISYSDMILHSIYKSVSKVPCFSNLELENVLVSLFFTKQVMNKPGNSLIDKIIAVFENVSEQMLDIYKKLVLLTLAQQREGILRDYFDVVWNKFKKLVFSTKSTSNEESLKLSRFYSLIEVILSINVNFLTLQCWKQTLDFMNYINSCQPLQKNNFLRKNCPIFLLKITRLGGKLYSKMFERHHILYSFEEQIYEIMKERAFQLLSQESYLENLESIGQDLFGFITGLLEFKNKKVDRVGQVQQYGDILQNVADQVKKNQPHSFWGQEKVVDEAQIFVELNYYNGKPLPINENHDKICLLVDDCVKSFRQKNPGIVLTQQNHAMHIRPLMRKAFLESIESLFEDYHRANNAIQGSIAKIISKSDDVPQTEQIKECSKSRVQTLYFIQSLTINYIKNQFKMRKPGELVSWIGSINPQFNPKYMDDSIGSKAPAIVGEFVAELARLPFQNFNFMLDDMIQTYTIFHNNDYSKMFENIFSQLFIKQQQEQRQAQLKLNSYIEGLIISKEQGKIDLLLGQLLQKITNRSKRSYQLVQNVLKKRCQLYSGVKFNADDYDDDRMNHLARICCLPREEVFPKAQYLRIYQMCEQNLRKMTEQEDELIIGNLEGLLSSKYYKGFKRRTMAVVEAVMMEERAPNQNQQMYFTNYSILMCYDQVFRQKNFDNFEIFIKLNEKRRGMKQKILTCLAMFHCERDVFFQEKSFESIVYVLRYLVDSDEKIRSMATTILTNTSEEVVFPMLNKILPYFAVVYDTPYKKEKKFVTEMFLSLFANTDPFEECDVEFVIRTLSQITGSNFGDWKVTDNVYQKFLIEIMKLPIKIDIARLTRNAMRMISEENQFEIIKNCCLTLCVFPHTWESIMHLYSYYFSIKEKIYNPYFVPYFVDLIYRLRVYYAGRGQLENIISYLEHCYVKYEFSYEHERHQMGIPEKQRTYTTESYLQDCKMLAKQYRTEQAEKQKVVPQDIHQLMRPQFVDNFLDEILPDLQMDDQNSFLNLNDIQDRYLLFKHLRFSNELDHSNQRQNLAFCYKHDREMGVQIPRSYYRAFNYREIVSNMPQNYEEYRKMDEAMMPQDDKDRVSELVEQQRLRERMRENNVEERDRVKRLITFKLGLM